MTSDFFKQPTVPPLSMEEIRQKNLASPLPTKVGPYPIEALLDKGGMSLLYLGSDPATQVPLTIKVLLPKYVTHPEMTSRFLVEAQIVALADHPNIIKLYGYGEWEGGLYIAMEFIEGISLRQLLLQSPPSLKRALEIVLDIAYALCHLHTHGVIHRDLKPENVLINASNQIKVIDFGIAQLLGPSSNEALDHSKRFMGTPVYMSPEQRQNPASVSYPSDIYALGIITYELVLGQLSHGQIHLNLMPRGLQKILQKSLQPNPRERYADVVDFISDLSTYLHSEKLSKERFGEDQARQLLEQVDQLEHLLAPQSIPPSSLNNSFLDSSSVGWALHRPPGGCLMAFFDENQLLIAQPTTEGPSNWTGLIYLKGCWEALRTLPPQEAWSRLASLIPQAPLPLNCTWFGLAQTASGHLWQSTGHPLWKIEDHKAFPLSEVPPFEANTHLIVTSPNFILHPFSQEMITQWIEELSNLPPKKFAEQLLRKARALHPKKFDEAIFYVLAVAQK